MAQNTINMKLAFGVVGEMYDSSIKRVTPYKLGAALNIGNPVWIDANGTAYAAAAAGRKLAGIAVSPKEYINRSASFAASLALNAGEIVQVADVGHVNVIASGAVSVGADVYVIPSTGVFTTAANDGAASNPVSYTKVGKCVRAGATASGQVFVLQIEL